MAGIDSISQGSANPNIALGDGRGTRYPNQFFDLSQQYMPPTIKELFRWCTFYYYNSPLIGASIKKVSRYPITDVIFDDEHESVRDIWQKVLADGLKIKDRLMEVNLDYHVYGNAFVSLHFPFTRFLICNGCSHRQPIKQWEWSFRMSTYEFQGFCPHCNQSGPLRVKDVPYRDPKGLRIIRWNPENMQIKFNEYTGRYVYMYTVPPKLKNAINRGDKDILEDIPLVVLEAIRKRRMIRFSEDNLKHLKNPTLAEQDQGWGKPAIIHVLKDMFYFYTLRRAQEAIALEHIVPFDMIYPLPNAQQDPYIHTDLASWRHQLEEVIKKHRQDPNYKAVIPIPVGFGRLGGDGKALLLSPELNYITQTVVGGMGIPQEFLFGGLNFCLIKSTACVTSRGLLRMEELCPEEPETREADFSVMTKDGVERAALVHRTPPRKQVKIKMRSGLTLTGSPIHKVWTIDGQVEMGWRELQHFKPGEYVALKKQSGLWGSREMKPELARLLGYLVAEGTTTEKIAADFSNTDKEILEDYVSCFDAVFDKRPAIMWRGDNAEKSHLPCAVVQCRDSKITDYMKSIGMHHYSATRSIPRIIREGTKEVVVEFLKALFSGDGCIVDTDKKQSVHYNSMSERLVEEVQLLLLNLGILSTRYPPYATADEASFSGVNNATHSLQIRSAYVTLFMREIGFSTERKNKLYREATPRQAWRCEANKIPYVMDNLKALRTKQNGCGAWIKEHRQHELQQEVYTVKEVAKILDRDVSSVLIYIRKGQMPAEREERTDGRYATYFVKKADLDTFLESYGTQKRAAIGQTTWELTDNNYEHVNWEGVKALDPVLYDRVQEAKAADHWWDEIEEVSFLADEVEMCDLTVYNTHSYVANGVISHNTGSSISLRTLENDFIQNRSQLLDLVYWIHDKIRIWLTLPPCKSMRFADFRMADDIQKNQQLIGLNAQGKVSDQTLLTELGYDYDQEVKKRMEEIYVANYLMDLQSKGGAKSQGEASLIQFNYQQKIQELTEKAQADAQARITALGGQMGGSALGYGEMAQPGQLEAQGVGGPAAGQQGAGQPQPSGGAGGTSEFAQKSPDDQIQAKVSQWASQLANGEPNRARMAIGEVKAKMPDIGALLEQQYNSLMAAGTDPGAGQAPGGQPPAAGQPQGGAQPNMNPLPVRGAPRGGQGLV
jgi:hypothetical protein